MRLRQRTVIDRPADQVWRHVIRPESFRRWNEKITGIDVVGEFRVGQPFTTHYQWRGKTVQCASIATDIQEGRVLELRHTALVGPGAPPNMEVRERITLVPRGARTVVTKVVTMENDGIPWFVRPLIWLINRFGEPVRPSPLKVLCEAEASR